MAFVIEEITEEGWKKLEEIKLSKGTKFNTNSWTIDREEDSFLVYEYTYRDGPPYYKYFLFFWKGDVFELKADSKSTGTYSNEDITVEWIIYNKFIPDSLTEHKEEIIKAIENAFNVHGLTGVASSRYSVSSVETKFTYY